MDSVLDLIRNLSGKYAKQTLTRLEGLETLSPDVRKAIRKIVLDGFNDLFRDVLRESKNTSTE